MPLHYQLTEEDERTAQALRLPYPEDYRNGRSNRGFSDLRGMPEMARQVPEAVGSPALQDLLAQLAATGSEFISIGCETGLTEPQSLGEPFQAGGYIQIAFADLAGRALDGRLHRRMSANLEFFLRAAVDDRTWAVEFTPTVVGAEALGGPEMVWSPVINFAGIDATLEGARASCEVLIRQIGVCLADPTL